MGLFSCICLLTGLKEPTKVFSRISAVEGVLPPFTPLLEFALVDDHFHLVPEFSEFLVLWGGLLECLGFGLSGFEKAGIVLHPNVIASTLKSRMN